MSTIYLAGTSPDNLTTWAEDHYPQKIGMTIYGTLHVVPGATFEDLRASKDHLAEALGVGL